MLTTPFSRKLSFFKFFVVYLTTIRPLLTWFPSRHRFPLSQKLDHFWFVRKSAKKRFATPPPTKSSSLNIKLHHPLLITPLFHPRPTLLMVVAALPLGVVVVVGVALVADKDTIDPPNPDSSTWYPSFRPLVMLGWVPISHTLVHHLLVPQMHQNIPFTHNLQLRLTTPSPMAIRCLLLQATTITTVHGPLLHLQPCHPAPRPLRCLISRPS